MLQSQRFLAFSSRIHTFLLLLLCFLLLAYLGGSYAKVSDDFVHLLFLLERIVCWTSYLFSVWLVCLCFISWFDNKICPVKFFVLTLLRTISAFLISFLFAVVEHLVNEGLTIGLKGGV